LVHFLWQYLILINLSSRRITAAPGLPDAAGFALVKVAGHADPLDIVLPNFHLNGYDWSFVIAPPDRRQYHQSRGTERLSAQPGRGKAL
jgi:hypothetical protein